MRVTIELPSYFTDEDTRHIIEKRESDSVRMLEVGICGHYPCQAVCLVSDELTKLRKATTGVLDEIEIMIRLEESES